jgi:hypothetical protein
VRGNLWRTCQKVYSAKTLGYRLDYRGSIPGMAGFFSSSQDPHWLWTPSSLLPVLTMVLSSGQGVKRITCLYPVRGLYVELYLHFSIRLLDMIISRIWLNVWFKQRTDHHGRVVNTPASYSGDPGFQSWPGDRLSLLRIFVVPLSPSKRMPR